MSGGGLIQLAITGVQDQPLISDPEITFFKKVYKRHTPFIIYQNNRYLGGLKFNNSSTHIIEKNGDLLYNQYLKIDIPHFIINNNIDVNNINEYININSVEVYNNNNLCYIYNINGKNYVIDKKYFNLIDIPYELYKLDNNVLTDNVLPSYIKFVLESFLYKLIDNNISPIINILFYNSNLLENIYLNESLYNSTFSLDLMTIKTKYSNLYKKFKYELFNNYQNKYYFNGDYNFIINNKSEVERYYDNLNDNSLEYDMDVAYKYCLNNFLKFEDYKNSILPYNSLVLLLILNFLYSNNNLIFTIWKKYEISDNNNINVNNNYYEMYNFKHEWTKKFSYYSNVILKTTHINNPLYESFLLNYTITGENIINIINNIKLSNPTSIYIKLKTILSRFYQVPNLQLNYNNYYYATNYDINNFYDLYNNDNINYQLNYETDKYITLISNSENLSSNEMNNLTPVDIEHVLILISYDFIDNLFSLYNLNKSIKSFLILWRNNVMVRLYKKYLDIKLFNNNNGGLYGFSNRKSTFYYSLYPTQLYLIDEYKNSFYELFYKESWIGYLSINNNNFINLLNNIYDININLTDVLNLDTSINISNNSINLNKNFNKLSIQNNYNYIYYNKINDEYDNNNIKSIKLVDYIDNKLYIKFDNYYDDNSIIILKINNIETKYNKIYYENKNNIFYLVINCNNNLKLNNNDVININITFNLSIPLVLFYKNNMSYPNINTKKYYLYNKKYNTINNIDTNLLNSTSLKLLNIVYYNKINPPFNFDLIDIFNTENLSGYYSYCITFYTNDSESDISIIKEIDVPLNKIVKIYNLPISDNPNVIGRKIYRTQNNKINFYLLTTITNNTETIYIDKINDDKLGINFKIGLTTQYNFLPNSNTNIKTTIINVNNYLTDMNNNKITLPTNLDNIHEIYIEEFMIPYETLNINNFIIDNNKIIINNNYDYNSLYYLVNNKNYKDNIKLIPSQSYVPYKSSPFTILTRNGNISFPLVWEFVINGYYYNQILDKYYIIYENGYINIINFNNINPVIINSLNNINEYAIYNNNLYYYGSIITSGYYKFNDRKINIYISNTIKKYNEITLTYYSSFPENVINNSYIIFNNNLYYGDNNTWNIISKGYYYVTSNNQTYNNKYIYINNNNLFLFTSINASNYEILPAIGINDTYIIYNNNLYYGKLNKWELIIQGNY